MSKQKISLICNAHLDPVWLWTWEEGVAEAISTFRVAADFCDKFENFVFNHNEAILYKWVEENDPNLFKRIQNLVKQGKWHIMGGWYLQPDCNMVAGEGILRQIEQGREYFKQKFDKEPTVAINFDSFGHSRGLVQILAKTGYKGYLFCRPNRYFDGKIIKEWGFDTFKWEGFDGSSIIGHRHFEIYNSKLGKARKKLEEYLKVRENVDKGLILWGIGDHGGGPSLIDLKQINEFIEEENSKRDIYHSFPEEYFDKFNINELPVIKNSLNPWAPGCYTTLTTIKRAYRELESALLLTEKMASNAAITTTFNYPSIKLKEAETDLLFTQFHDILPGTLIKGALDDALNSIGHAKDILGKIRIKSFISMIKDYKKAENGTIPVFIYNPHNFEINQTFSCEFNMIEEFNKGDFEFWPIIKDGKEILPSQLEQEVSNLPLQWRRKIVFNAKLAPNSIKRIDCTFEKKAFSNKIIPVKDNYIFDNGKYRIKINSKTGLVDEYFVNNVSYLNSESFKAIIIEDDDHSIGTFVKSFTNEIGCFKLADEAKSAKIAGIYYDKITPLHIIEDGKVRTIIEGIFEYKDSYLIMQYILPKFGTEIQVKIIINWNENNKMVKLTIPSKFNKTKYLGHTAFGFQELYTNGDECVSQKWNAIEDCENKYLLSIINDCTYGSSFNQNEARISLLRSPRYGCLVKEKDRPLLYNKGYIPHSDIGIHEFNFFIKGENKNERIEKLGHETIMHSEPPYILSYFPDGNKKGFESPFSIEGKGLINTSARINEKQTKLMYRVFNSTDTKVTGIIKSNKIEQYLFNPFEVKNFILNLETGDVKENKNLIDWEF